MQKLLCSDFKEKLCSQIHCYNQLCISSRVTKAQSLHLKSLSSTFFN